MPDRSHRANNVHESGIEKYYAPKNALVGQSRVLVLNATYEPLGVVASRRAVVLVMQEKAELLHSTGRRFHSARNEIPEPSVVRLAYRVKVPYLSSMALTRKAVFTRDDYRCQYCGGPAESIDHVIPRAKGGPHTWDNVVAACRACNTKKEDRLPHEIGFVLKKTPHQPRDRWWYIRASNGNREDWAPYLGAPAPLSA